MKLPAKPVITMWQEVSPHLALVVLCILTCVLAFLSEMAHAVSTASPVPSIHAVPYQQPVPLIWHKQVSEVLLANERDQN